MTAPTRKPASRAALLLRHWAALGSWLARYLQSLILEHRTVHEAEAANLLALAPVRHSPEIASGPSGPRPRTRR